MLEIAKVTDRIITDLYRNNSHMLGKFRSAQTKKPYDCPELVLYLAKNIEQENVKLEEEIIVPIFYAVVAYSLAQQSKPDMQNARGITFGTLVGKVDRAKVFKMIQSRSELDRKMSYIYQVIRLSKVNGRGAKLDFGKLAEDLYKIQKDNTVLTQWVLDSVMAKKKGNE